MPMALKGDARHYDARPLDARGGGPGYVCVFDLRAAFSVIVLNSEVVHCGAAQVFVLFLKYLSDMFRSGRIVCFI